MNGEGQRPCGGEGEAVPGVVVGRALVQVLVAFWPGRVLGVIADFERGAHASDDKTVVVMRRSWGSIA